MHRRKLTLEIDIDDDAVDSIEDLEREILAQDICGQAAMKYLDSLQDDLAQQVEIRKGSKKCTSKHPILNLASTQRERSMKRGKNVHSALSTQPR
ncbi:MAG: hypothetical protein U9N46_12200 [Euryarchaeota archaeon]|nr:MAG: hypothetical protein C5S47_04135 [ANME-2 cluster archaeon]MEA1865924.1 hypothetical protein [Euryarchaeota archaeon]